ncbi:hypothetical protein [Bradyrhizobium ivorense]|uniref:hypothetical protein n=1 Tax=Bradyrhizobium ivorense TaxID=2511166 RepID=UPI001FCF0D12|nr:hypothetical protein [Bradyrhizobium ivorense]
MSDFDRTEREVLAGLQLLWIAHDGERIEAAAVTKLVVRGDRRVCIIAACGGDNRKRWVPLLAGIEDYARAEGCSAVSFTGRRGWQRVLDGYALKFVIMEKGLS